MGESDYKIIHMTLEYDFWKIIKFVNHTKYEKCKMMYVNEGHEISIIPSPFDRLKDYE